MCKLIDRIKKGIVKRRKELGLTQKQVGEKCGMSRENYQLVESGKGGMSLKTLDRVLKGLDTTIEELLDE